MFMKQWLLADLIDAVENELNAMGYPLKTKQMYHYTGFAPIKRYYASINELVYSKEITADYDAIMRLEAEKYLIYTTKRQLIRKAATLLAEYADTEKIIWRSLSTQNVRQLTPKYSNWFEEYVNRLAEIGRRRTTIRGQKPIVKHFLHYLEDCGIYETTQISRDNVLAYIPAVAEKYKRPGDALIILRPFLQFLHSENHTDTDFSSVLRVQVPTQRRYYYGFSEQEVSDILSAVKKETSYGKRDYAIIMLAANTGIRAVDALNLKISDIDWDAKVLNIIQHKTEEPLILPLDIPTCNAIADYILNARPETDSPQIFIRNKRPYRKLESWSGYAIIKRAARKAGITWLPEERKGFHSIRRSIGNRLLEAETPLSMISEILGHAKVDSSKPYMALHHSKLGMCALTLCGIKSTRGELQ
jgi:integrase